MMQKTASIVLLGAALLLPAAAFADEKRVTAPDFTGIVKDNRDAVVNISTTKQMESGPATGMPEDFLERLPEDSPLREFFRRDERGGGPQRERSSLGSGFIIDESGHILTNRHVIADADEIIVRLNDHRQFEAEVLGADEASDVALLKIDASELPTVDFGDSDDLEVGEPVLAIGSPFGLDYTATAGIVSALNRKLPNDTYTPFIQTDVAVNPGNSGGPLFNSAGEVIGINAQIFSRTGGFMGLSFAVPINVARNIAEQLRETGEVQRGYLGVNIQPIDRDLASSFGLERPIGALVSDVRPDSPAEDAGLESGDVILTYDGREVADAASLPPMVGQTMPETEVELEIIRDGERRTIEVEVGELEREDQAPQAPSDDEDDGESSPANELGVTARELTESERAELDLGERGLLVERVNAGPAARAGIRPGDILLRVGREELRDSSDLEAALEELPRGQPIAAQIRRGDATLFVSLTLPEE